LVKAFNDAPDHKNGTRWKRYKRKPAEEDVLDASKKARVDSGAAENTQRRLKGSKNKVKSSKPKEKGPDHSDDVDPKAPDHSDQSS
jgi:hypothetical protein